MKTKITSQFIPLSRPEYVVNPELFQVALAWEELKAILGDEATKTDAYVYVREKGDPKSIKIKRTSPFGPRSSLDSQAFIGNLALSMDKAPEDAAIIGEALARSLEGIKSTQATGQCALPVTIQTALLQDLRGTTAKRNPSKLGANINALYSLGNPKGNMTASRIWWQQLTREKEPELLELIREITNKHLLPPEIKLLLEKALETQAGLSNGNTNDQTTAPAWLTASTPSTPFTWFNQAWNKLCSTDWFEALPRRRWTDWASCILRTAVGIGYLWEMHFYSRLIIKLLDEETASSDVAHAALHSSTGLLTWSQFAPTSRRDVASYIKNITQQGSRSLDIINELSREQTELLPSNFHNDTDGLTNWVSLTREKLDEKKRSELSLDLAREKSTGWNNTYETIRYALLCRDPFGRNADYYGLLAKHGSRYTVVEPSSEWIVVIASLAAPGPGTVIRMEDLINNLASLGLRPDYHTLIDQVERAGLGRGSHDADEAIEIVTGF